MPLYALDGIHPELPASGRCWIASDAVLVGKVKIEEDVSIWFHSVLRGDNEWITVGARTNVQDGCVLHTDPGFPLTIGAGCTIGHGAILHGCVIGENCLIGMGATLLNGVKLGAYCFVGANALLTEGKEFPDHSLIVGAPAKAIRKVDERAIKVIELSADVYNKRWQRYRREFKPIG